MKKWLIGIPLALCLAAGAAFLILKDKTYTITLTEAALQAQANERFPVTKNYLLLFGVTYHDPRIELNAADGSITLGLSATTAFLINNESIQTTLVARGRLDYVPEEGAFYLRNFVLQDFELGKVPEQQRQIIKQISEGVINTYFSSKPVYRLSSDDVKQVAARLVLQSITVQDKALHITLGLGNT